MNKKYHSFLTGVSILPALLVLPAVADDQVLPGFFDDYVGQVVDQLSTVLNTQNATGFDIGSITISNDMTTAGDANGFGDKTSATQYVKLENVSLPTGIENIGIDMYVYSRDNKGLWASEIPIMKNVLNNDQIQKTDGSVVVTLADAIPLLDGMIVNSRKAQFFGDDTWILSDIRDALASDEKEIAATYLYTGNDFELSATIVDTVTSQIGQHIDDIKSFSENFAGMIVEEAGYEGDLLKKMILEDALGIGVPAELEDFSGADALEAYMGNLKTILNTASDSTFGTLKLNVGTLNVDTANIALSALDMTVDTATLDSSKLTVSNSTITVSNIATLNSATLTTDGSRFVVNHGAGLNINTTGSAKFMNHIATTAGGAIYNEGEVTLSGTNTFAGNRASNKANDISNNGTLNIASGVTTIKSGIDGTGDLVIAEGATLDIGASSVVQDSITLGGTMLATLRSGNAQITTGSFIDDGGTLKLSFAKDGTYHVFGDAVLAENSINATSSVYDISWNGGDLIASMKSVADIAAENKIEEEAAIAVSNLNRSTSGKLKDLGLKIQEKLAEATPEAREEVENIVKEIHPETESVAQSVVTSVQTTVTNLASARMATPIISGRSGGDAKFTAGGVWAQGLINKTKQSNAFHGDTRGIALGLDGTINKDWMIGAGYSYANSDITGTQRDTDIDSHTVFVYGQYKPAEWYVNAVLNYTLSDFSEDGASMVTANYDVDSFGATVKGGYDFASGITPELGLRYMHVNADEYTNSMGVKISSKDTDFLTGVLGAKYAFNVAVKEMTFIPMLNVALKYDMLSDRNVSTVVMPGVDAYTLRGERLSRFGSEFGIGLGMKYRTMDLSINYDIDVREDYTSQTGMLKFRYNF